MCGRTLAAAWMRSVVPGRPPDGRGKTSRVASQGALELARGGPGAATLAVGKMGVEATPGVINMGARSSGIDRNAPPHRLTRKMIPQASLRRRATSARPLNLSAHKMSIYIRILSAFLVATTLSACGESPTEPDSAAPARVDGVWQATEPDVREMTIELSADGTARLVEADLSGLACTSSAGSWTSDGDRLVLRLTPTGETSDPEIRSFDYDVSEGTLVLTTGAQSATYRPASGVPSCVTYGFGTWQGTLRARIDDVPMTFTNISVNTERIRAGSVEILACLDTDSSCETDNVVLLLQVTAPGVLTPGTYPLGDQSSGFYGLVNLFPDDPDFPGFDSLRLSPTGAFLLTSIGPERVVASFEFRANERATNAPPAPDGSTFALVTDGTVNLTYQ